MDDATLEFLLKKIPRRVRKYRTIKKMTQQELAEKIGLTRPQVTNIELRNSEMTLRNLYKIAYALDIRINQLLSDFEG